MGGEHVATPCAPCEPCEPWSGRYREAPEAFTNFMTGSSAKLEQRPEPTPKHKVIVLPPSRRAPLRSPSPENNSPLVRLTRLRSPEISPRLLRPMPLFAQTAPTRRSLGARNQGTQELGILHPRTGSPVRCEAPGIAYPTYPRTSSRLSDRTEKFGGRTPVTPTVPAFCPSRIPNSWVTKAPTAPFSYVAPARPSRHSVGSCTGSRPRSATPPFGRSSSQGRRAENAENRQPLNRASKVGHGNAGPGVKKPRQGRAHSPELEPTVERKVEYAKDEAGRTELMHAARDGDLVRAAALICAGLPVDATDSCKCTALMYATTYGHVALARCLIEHAANVNALSHDRWTPLIAAVYNGHLPVAKYLLSKAANVECADDRGWTALMHVAFNGKVDILQCLLEHRADTEQKDHEGRTALVYAAFSGHLESVKLLLASPHGAKRCLDGADGPCSTALMFAADKGHMEVVRTILDATFISVRARASALELANLHGHHEVALSLALLVLASVRSEGLTRSVRVCKGPCRPWDVQVTVLCQATQLLAELPSFHSWKHEHYPIRTSRV